MQTIDEARMMLLKDIFVKYMILEVETLQCSISEAEAIMNSLLSLSPAKEIEAFVALQKGGPMAPPQEPIRTNPQVFTSSPAVLSVSSRPPVQTRSSLSVRDDPGLIRSKKRMSRFGTILRSRRNTMRLASRLRGFH